MTKKYNDEYSNSGDEAVFEFREDVDKQTIEFWDPNSNRRIVLKAVLQDAKSIATYIDNLRDRMLNYTFGREQPESFMDLLFEPSETGKERKAGKMGLIQWNSDCDKDYEQFLQELEAYVVEGQLLDDKTRYLVDVVISKGGPKGYCDEEIWRALKCRRWFSGEFYYMKNDPNVQDADKQQSKINILYVSDK